MNSFQSIAWAQPGPFFGTDLLALSLQSDDRLRGRIKFSSVFIQMFPSTNAQHTTKPSDCLSLYRLPARLDAAQTAALLGFQPHDIAILIDASLLKPLGRPAPNGTKYFAVVEIEQLREDREWLDKATRTVSRRWQEKNRTARTSRDASSQTE